MHIDFELSGCYSRTFTITSVQAPGPFMDDGFVKPGQNNNHRGADMGYSSQSSKTSTTDEQLERLHQRLLETQEATMV